MTMVRAALIGSMLLLVLAGCNSSPLEGAKGIGGGRYWKLRVLGEGARNPTDSDSVLVRVRIAQWGHDAGSLFSTEEWYGMHGEQSELFGRLRTGDSVSLAMEHADVPWIALGVTPPAVIPDSPWIAMELGLRAIRSNMESREVHAAILASRTSSDEDSTLARFFAGSKVAWKDRGEVRYELDDSKGKGPLIRSGQLVTMHYTARFLDNGRVFDDTRKGRSAITWRLGDPGQVMKGLEVAAHLMRAGDKGSFVFPSEYAFGPRGSSSGIVPPWTPVLYEVEVMAVE